MNFISVDQIYSLMEQVFQKLGVPESEAKICADVLIASDLSGIESHGVGRLKMYYDRIKAGIQNVQTKIDVIKDEKAIAVWDGNHGMGQVIGHKAMQRSMEKAAEYGVGIVAVRNSTHYGICGYYCHLASDQNMIGITFTNARPSIAPNTASTPEIKRSSMFQPLYCQEPSVDPIENRIRTLLCRSAIDDRSYVARFQELSVITEVFVQISSQVVPSSLLTSM